jgi:hypothetical protein
MFFGDKQKTKYLAKYIFGTNVRTITKYKIIVLESFDYDTDYRIF